MSRRSKRKDEAEKPIGVRAEKLAEWLADIQESAGLTRAFKRWWHRSTICELALEALDELAEMEKKNGMHDKIRRSLNTMVVAMGGAELKWQGAGKAKDD